MAAGPEVRTEGLLPAAPPPRSLLTIPGVIVTADSALDGGRWENGVAIQPESCDVELDFDVAAGESTADFPYWWQCPDSGGTAPTAALAAGTKLVGAGRENLVFTPYQVWAGYRCSTLDVRPGTPRFDEVSSRVLRRLEAITPAALERELWTGNIADAAGYANPALADVGSTAAQAGVPLGFVTALAEVEQALAECHGSGRHIIHAPPRVVTHWRSRGLVEPTADGRALVTALGTFVAPGSGYPGTAPGHVATGWTTPYIYGTGMVRVFLGAPTAPRGDTAEFVDPVSNVNDVVVRAERSALAVWSTCCWVGARTNLCDEYCGSGS